MSSGERIPLAEGQHRAAQVMALLASVCEEIHLAGSIRRGEPTVGDVELVAVPCVQPSLGLFGDATGEQVSALDAHVAELIEQGVFSHRLDKNGRAACGSRYKRLSVEGVALDLFAVLEPAQLGVILTIRTGPSAFSHRLVTPQAEGGWLPNGHRIQDGALRWRLDGTIIPTPTEASLFAAIGRDYIPPEERR